METKLGQCWGPGYRPSSLRLDSVKTQQDSLQATLTSLCGFELEKRHLLPFSRRQRVPLAWAGLIDDPQFKILTKCIHCFLLNLTLDFSRQKAKQQRDSQPVPPAATDLGILNGSQRCPWPTESGFCIPSPNANISCGSPSRSQTFLSHGAIAVART